MATQQSTDQSPIGARPEFSEFAVGIAGNTFDARSMIMGARRMFERDVQWESSGELCSVLRLLCMAEQKLEQVERSMDGAQFDYQLRKGPHEPTQKRGASKGVSDEGNGHES